MFYKKEACHLITSFLKLVITFACKDLSIIDRYKRDMAQVQKGIP